MHQMTLTGDTLHNPHESPPTPTRRSWLNILTLGLFDGRTATMPSRTVGVLLDDDSGREDRFTDLPTAEKLATYETMRREDSELRALIRNVKLPVRAANYAIECDDDDIRDFCMRQLGLGDEDNNIDFQQLLIDILTFLDFGYCIFEYQTALIDGRFVELKEVSLRPAKTLQEFIMDEGRVTGVIQNTKEGEVTIDQNIMHLAFESEGNNPAGQSLLEACVNDYDAKTEILRLSMLHRRRFAVGLPVITYDPVKTSPTQEQFYKDALKEYSEGKSGGMLLPFGTQVSIAGIDGAGDRFDMIPAIQYHNQQMAKAFLSQLIELGTTATGSRAVGDDFSTNFFNGIKAITDQITETITNTLLTPLVEENFPQTVPVRLVATDILPEDKSALLDNIHNFLASNILGTNEAQREHIRELLELPPGDDSDIGGLQEQERKRAQEDQRNAREEQQTQPPQLEVVSNDG